MKKSARRLLAFGAIFAGIWSIVLGWNIFAVKGVTYTWDNGGGDGLWSTCTNWTSDTCPGASDIARFDPATSDTSSTIDGGFAGSVGGFIMLTGFTGTITQSRSLTVGASDFAVVGGTFSGGSADIDINGDFSLSNGTFISTSGILSVRDNFTQSSGTFTHNSGTLTLDTAGTIFNVPSSISLNNLTINGTSDFVSVSASDSDTITVLGTLTLTNSNILTPLTIDAQGPVVHTSTFDGGTGLILISAGAGNIDAVTGGQFPAVTLSTARTLNMTAGSVIFDSSVTVEDGGTFNGSSGTTEIRGSLIVTGASTFTASSGTTFVGQTTNGAGHDAFTIGSGATFDPNGGTIELGNRRILDIDVATTETFANLTFDLIDGTVVNIPADDTLVATGTLLLEDGVLVGGTVEAQSTVTHLAGFGFAGAGAGGTIIHVTGAVTIDPTVSGTDAVWPGLNLDNAGAVFNGVGAGNTLAFEGDVTINAGTFNATSGNVYLYNDNDFDLSGGTFNNDSGTVAFFQGTQSVLGSPTFHNLTVSDTQLNFEALTTTVVNGNITMTGTGSSQTLLRSTSAGVQATIDYNGSVAELALLDVQDINWQAVAPARCFYGCENSGNTTNWDFNQVITVTDISGNTTEAGGTATFTVVLSHTPSANVTIGVTSSDTTEGTVSTSTLTFTSLNWSTPQTVTVTGVDDVLDDEGVSYTAVLAAAASSDTAYSGLNPRDLTVLNIDNDTTADTVDYDAPTEYVEQNTAKTDITGSVGILQEDDFIATTEVAETVAPDFSGNGGTDLVYDSQNNYLWFAREATASIYRYDITGDALTSYATGGVGAGRYLAMDSEATRNRVWMTVADDNNVVAFNDDGTVFGTFSLNVELGFFTSPNRIIFVDNADADAANDSMWIGNEDATGQPALTKLRASNGAPFDTDLATSTYEVSTDITGSYGVEALAYDSTDNQIWTYVSSGDLVGLSQTTGSPVNGTIANSTYAVPQTNVDGGTVFGDYTDMVYDDLNDFVWLMGKNDIFGFNTDTDTFDTVFQTGATLTSNNLNSGMSIDTTNDILLITDIYGTIYRYDLVNFTFLGAYASSDGSTDLVKDSEGDWWVLDVLSSGEGLETIGSPAVEEIRYGVTADNYYTIVTDTGSVVDASGWTDLTDVTVTETLDSGFIYYSMAFGTGTTYSVYSSGWRDIASSSNAVHGGTEGVWYYRNNASVWTAASSDNSQTALSQAVAAGANNQMSGTATNALSGANLVSAGGWSVADDEVRVGATFFSTDYRNNPAVDLVAFTASGATPGITVSAISGDTTEAGVTATFTVVLDSQPSADVTIGVTSSDTSEGTVSTALLTFTNGNWATPQTVTVTGVDDVLDDGDILYTILLAAASSADLTYNGIDPSNVSVTNLDNDASGNSTPGAIIVINEAITLETCTTSRNIVATLEGNNIDEYLISEDQAFVSASWQTFTADVLGETSMSVNFNLSAGDGAKTVYAVFRSSTLDVSATVSDTITLDTATACTTTVTPPPEEPTPPTDEEPLPPEDEVPPEEDLPPEEEPLPPEEDTPEPPVEVPPVAAVSNTSFSIATALCSAALIVPLPPVVPPLPVITAPTPIVTIDSSVSTEILPEIPGITEVQDTPASPVIEEPAAPLTPKPTPPQPIKIPAITTSPHTTLQPIIDSAGLIDALRLYSLPLSVGLAAGAFTLLASSFNLLSYLWYIFTSPVLLFGKKRREAYGLTYNSVTKVPVGLSTVRAFSTDTGRLVKTLVSNPEGKYFFAAKPGNYRFEVLKSGFTFPSVFLANVKEDANHAEIYHGDTLNVTEDNPFVNKHIPVDPSDLPEYHSPINLKLKKLLRGLQMIIGISGLGFSIVAVILAPSVVAAIMVVAQILVSALILRLARTHKPKALGDVLDASTGKPLKDVTVRLFEPTYNKLIETTSTSPSGKYWFVIGPNEYYVSYSKPGYQEKIIKPVDTRKQAELSVYSPQIQLQRET